MRIRLRHRYAREGEGVSIDRDDPVRAYIEACSTTVPRRAGDRVDAVEMSWEPDDPLRVLDIDYHGTEPTVDQEELAGRLACTAWVPSAGGLGIHAVYVDAEGYTAEQLAAVDAVRARIADPGISGAEVKHAIRQPVDPTAIRVTPAVSPLLGLAALVKHKGASEAAIDALLVERGWTRGTRIPHDQCPIDPLHESTGPDNPVLIGDAGVFCHSCEGRDVWYPGSTRAGWVPYRLLAESDVSALGATVDAARYLTHWAHARFAVAGELGQPLDLPQLSTEWEAGREPGTWRHARAVYSALCAYLSPHGPLDPRLGSVWTGGTWFVRAIGGRWVDARGARRYDELGQGQPDKAALACLPAVQYVVGNKDDEKGLDKKVSASDVSRAAARGTLPGYRCLRRHYGLRAWGVYHEYADTDTELTAHLVDPGRSPRYLAGTTRQDVTDAWGVIERRFPGVERNYLLLCLAARILAESGAHDAPLIAVTGVSGSAKSTTPKLAARILGDRYYEPQPDLPPNETAMAVGEFGSRVGLVVVNELNKYARGRRGVTAASCWTPILGMQREFGFRKLYVGPVSTTVGAAVILTDVFVPDEIIRDPQYARRLIYVHLPRRTAVDWRTLGGHLDQWPANADDPRAAERACDVLCSYVVDRWFGPGAWPTIWTIAESLGYGTLESHAAEHELDDSRLRLLRLFDAITHPETADQKSGVRPNGRWRVADVDGADSLSIAWRDLRDGAGARTSAASEMAHAFDVAKLFDVDPPVQLDVAEDSLHRTRIRFRSGQGRGKAQKVNEDLVGFLRPYDEYQPLEGGLVGQRMGAT